MNYVDQATSGDTSTLPLFRFSILGSWFFLASGILAYIVIFTAAAWYKYDAHMMGFDLGVHEQVLWNTAHGRIAASSVFDSTSSYFGIDIIPTELLLTPIYALFPSVRTMLLLQVIAVALGAVPVYLIVRDRFRSSPTDHRPLTTDQHVQDSRWSFVVGRSSAELAGLIFAAAFLLYLPVEYTTLYEFQIRAFATTFLLWAWWAMERQRFWLFLGCAVLALGCRSEAGLVVAGMGLYASCELQGMSYKFERKNNAKRKTQNVKLLKFGVLPIVLGLVWFVLCLQVLIPYFRGGVPSLYLSVVYGHLGNTPDSPRWLGDTPGEIFHTLLTQPGFVLREVFTGANGLKRWSYLLQMLLPFGFLMLLQPRLMLITLPIFALNLLSNTPDIHASVQKHYQALSVPFLVIGAAYGLHWLLTRTKNREPRTLFNLRDAMFSSRFSVLGSLIAVLLLSLGCNLYFRNPFFTLLDPKRSTDTARIAAVQRTLALVPPNAALTTTSTVGPHASRREGLYYVPGNVIYPANKVNLGEYLLLDPQDVRSLSVEQQANVSAIVASPNYQQIASDHGVALWKRSAP